MLAVFCAMEAAADRNKFPTLIFSPQFLRQASIRKKADAAGLWKASSAILRQHQQGF